MRRMLVSRKRQLVVQHEQWNAERGWALESVNMRCLASFLQFCQANKLHLGLVRPGS